MKKQLKTEEDKERREEVDINDNETKESFKITHSQVKYLIQRMENQLRAEAQNQVKLIIIVKKSAKLRVTPPKKALHSGQFCKIN